MFKRLLAATEMVDFCDAPVTAALKIAEQNKAQLSILHVLESDSTKDRHFVKLFRTGERIVTTPEYEETVKEEIRKSCADGLKSDVHYTIKVVPVFPGRKICGWQKKTRPI